MRRAVAGLVVVAAVSLTACGSSSPPKFANEAVFTDACQPIPVGQSLYFAPWKITGPKNQAEHIESIHLIPKATSPAIQVVSYFVQAKNAASPFGTSWTTSTISGFQRQQYVQETGLTAPDQVTVAKGATVNLAVVLHANGFGRASYEGMMVNYTYGSHAASETIPAAITAVGVKSYQDKAC